MGFTRRTIVRVDCKRDLETVCENLRHAYETLEDRFGELINEEGVFAGNLPPDISVGGPAGDVPLGDIVLIFPRENPEIWEQLTDIDVTTAPGDIFDPTAIGMTPAGNIGITLNTGVMRFYDTTGYSFNSPAVSISSLSDTALNTPTSLMFVNPDGRFAVAQGNASGRNLALVDFTDKVKPELLFNLDVTSVLTAPWTDVKWSPTRRILWMVDASAGDHIVGVRIDESGTMEVVANFIDTLNLNRPTSLVISDSEDTLYVGNTLRVVTVDVSDLDAITSVTNLTLPAGANASSLAKEYNRIAFTSTETNPVTVRVAVIDADDEQVITLGGSVQIPDGDSGGINLGGTMNGSIYSLVTRPSAMPTLLTLVRCIDTDAPKVIDQLEMGGGTAVGAYTTPASHIWLQYHRVSSPGFMATFRGGKSSVEDVGNPDTANQKYRAEAAYFRAMVQNGKSPFETVSRTVNVNFNSDLLDGQHGNEIIAVAVNEAILGSWFYHALLGAEGGI